MPPRFLAHVDLALEVDGMELVDFGIGDAGDVLGDEVVMLHRQHRQFQADHAPDLPRPQAAAIDDMLGEDLPLSVITSQEPSGAASDRRRG